MLAQNSLGSCFNANIRKIYPCRKSWMISPLGRNSVTRLGYLTPFRRLGLATTHKLC
jgi:hypothetical protein